MFRFQPRKRCYLDPVELGPQPLRWIREHRSFASREWIEGQVRYGEWVSEYGKPNHFRIYTIVYEGAKPITVLIKIKFQVQQVIVYHVHVMRKRR
jgi:hypothetical protein